MKARVLILELVSLYGSKTLKNADAWLEMPTGAPEELIGAVSTLMEKRNDLHEHRIKSMLESGICRPVLPA